ncbi:MAG: hypothetical protein KH386_09825 [Bacteroides sp.]|nr:hypothetical protein [Bacteroides sp.]
MENEALQLTASISETIQTRANEPASGTYYFSYVKNGATNTSTYSTVEVVFDDGDATSNLTWGGINKSSSLFVLDNVNVTNQYPTVTLPKTFDAGPAPANPGTGNDLLWDTVKVANVISAPLSPVHFVLEHRMSMLTFDISSRNSEIDGLLKSGKVSVQLSNVVVKPTTFNRSKGTVLSISDDKNNTCKLGGAYVSSDTEVPGGYITDNWIFPPQKFDNERPVLSITLERTIDDVTTKKTFKGVLPESMLYGGEYRSLEFISGCHLTVTVVLGNWDNLEVYFRPVLVEKWDELDIKDLNVNQIGVYTANELEELVGAYNDNPDKNNLTLWKYGIFSDSKWTFYLWKNLTINDASKIFDNTTNPTKLNFTTKAGYTFTFQSNEHTITYKDTSYKINSDGKLTTNP